MPTLETRFTAETKGLESGAKAASAAVKRVGDASQRAGRQSAASAKQAGDAWKQAADRMAQAGQQMQRVGAVIMGVGAAMVGTMMAGARAAASWAEQVEVFASANGMAIDDARALETALSASGQSMMSFGNAAMAVVNRMQQARDGNADAAQAFKDLGIDINDANVAAMSQVELMGLVAERLAKVRDEQRRLTLARGVGLSGRTIRAAMSATPEAMRAAREDPSFLTDEQHQRLLAVDDAVDALGFKLRNTLFRAIAEGAPALIDLIEHLNRILDRVNAWIERNPKLVGGLMSFIVKLGLAKIALGGVVNIMGGLFNLTSNVLLKMAGLPGAIQKAADAVMAARALASGAIGRGAMVLAGAAAVPAGATLAAGAMNQAAQRMLARDTGWLPPVGPGGMPVKVRPPAGGATAGASINVTVNGPNRRDVERRTRAFARELSRAGAY